MAHVAQWKFKEVDDLAQIAASAPVIAVAKIDAIPSNNMHDIRAKLRDHATIRAAKNRLLRRALEKAAENGRGGLAELATHLDGQSVLIASDMSPFKLYKSLDQAKSKAPAKAGQIAPNDIEVKKGDTPFKPGPIVGELQQAGIPAKIDQGKVVIASDKVLVKAGEPVPASVAKVLPGLEILPITVGLNLKAAWEDGILYKGADLDVDEEKILGDLLRGAANARALAIEVAYPTTEIMPDLLAKAHRDALSVALEAAFPDPATIEKLFVKAFGAAAAVARLAPDAISEETKAMLAASAAAAPAAPAKTDEKKDDEPEEEEVSEEEAAAGLGALFG